MTTMFSDQLTLAMMSEVVNRIFDCCSDIENRECGYYEVTESMMRRLVAGGVGWRRQYFTDVILDTGALDLLRAGVCLVRRIFYAATGFRVIDNEQWLLRETMGGDTMEYYFGDVVPDDVAVQLMTTYHRNALVMKTVRFTYDGVEDAWIDICGVHGGGLECGATTAVLTFYDDPFAATLWASLPFGGSDPLPQRRVSADVALLGVALDRGEYIDIFGREPPTPLPSISPVHDDLVQMTATLQRELSMMCDDDD